MPAARFDIAEIARSLEQMQQQFSGIERSLSACPGPLTGGTVANMVEGYRFVDRLLAERTDPFALGNSRLLLEINALVLCGPDSREREDYRLHLEQTKRQFYDDQQGGVGSLLEWCEIHAGDNLWKKVAGLYIQINSQPQLFIEGNHRSAILMASYLLGREGYPPFVMTSANAKELLDQSKPISDLKKHGLSTLWRLPALRNRLAATLKNGLERRHLLGG